MSSDFLASLHARRRGCADVPAQPARARSAERNGGARFVWRACYLEFAGKHVEGDLLVDVLQRDVRGHTRPIDRHSDLTIFLSESVQSSDASHS